MMFKYTLNNDIDFSTANFLKRGLTFYAGESLPQLYPFGRPISSAKKKDVMKLLQYIPPVCHPFYESLKEVTVKTHFDEDELLIESETEDPIETIAINQENELSLNELNEGKAREFSNELPTASDVTCRKSNRTRKISQNHIFQNMQSETATKSKSREFSNELPTASGVTCRKSNRTRKISQNHIFQNMQSETATKSKSQEFSNKLPTASGVTCRKSNRTRKISQNHIFQNMQSETATKSKSQEFSNELPTASGVTCRKSNRTRKISQNHIFQNMQSETATKSKSREFSNELPTALDVTCRESDRTRKISRDNQKTCDNKEVTKKKKTKLKSQGFPISEVNTSTVTGQLSNRKRETSQNTKCNTKMAKTKQPNRPNVQDFKLVPSDSRKKSGERILQECNPISEEDIHTRKMEKTLKRKASTLQTGELLASYTHSRKPGNHRQADDPIPQKSKICHNIKLEKITKHSHGLQFTESIKSVDTHKRQHCGQVEDPMPLICAKRQKFERK